MNSCQIFGKTGFVKKIGPSLMITCITIIYATSCEICLPLFIVKFEPLDNSFINEIIILTH